MSHICIIPGSNNSLTSASYYHIKNRNCYETISVLHSTDNLFHFFQTNEVHLVVTEDTNSHLLFRSLQGLPITKPMDILVIGETPSHVSDSYQVFSICKRKQLPAVLDVIDLISMQAHVIHEHLQKNSVRDAICRLYNTIRFVEFTDTSIIFHLKDSVHHLSFDFYQVMPFVDARFISASSSYLVNVNAVVKFDEDQIWMNQNEIINMTQEHKEECWKVLCKHFLPKKQCKPLFHTENKKENPLFR